MKLTLHQLECFLTVAKRLHFARAAGDLNLSQSALSEQVSKLEQQIGRRLFVRGNRAVSLTRDGSELVPLAENVVGAVDEISSWARDAARVPLDIGVEVTGRAFRRVLALMAAELPDLPIRLQSVGFTGAERALVAGEIDAAVIVGVGRPQVPNGLRAVDLGEEGLVAVVPASHPLAERPVLSARDLYGERLIGAIAADAEGGRGRLDWFEDIDPALLERCRILPLMNSADDAMELVAAGVGICLSGESATDTYARAGLAFVPLADVRPMRTLLLVRGRTPSTGLRELVRIAARMAD